MAQRLRVLDAELLQARGELTSVRRELEGERARKRELERTVSGQEEKLREARE